MARMDLRFSFFFTLIIAIAIAINILIASQAATALDLCTDATDPGLCNALVKENSDPKKATEFIVKKLITQTTKAKDKASKLDKDDNVKICLKSYADASSNLKLALKYLKNGDKGGFQTVVSGVIAFVETCQDASGVENKLTKNNTYLKLLADTCLSVYQQSF